MAEDGGIKPRIDLVVNMMHASRLRFRLSSASPITGQRAVTIRHGERETGFYIYRLQQVVIDVQPTDPDTCRVLVYAADREADIP